MRRRTSILGSAIPEIAPGAVKASARVFIKAQLEGWAQWPYTNLVHSSFGHNYFVKWFSNKLKTLLVINFLSRNFL